MFELQRLWSSSPYSTMQHHQQEQQQQQHEEHLSLVAASQREQNDHHRQLAENSTTTRSSSKNTIDLMDLTDFDVQLALTENLGVQIFEVTDIVTRWLNDAFRICLVNQLGSTSSSLSNGTTTTTDNNTTTDTTSDAEVVDVDTIMDQYADFDTIILLERNYNNNNNGGGNNRRIRRLQDTQDADEDADADAAEEDEGDETKTTDQDEEEPLSDTTVDTKDASTTTSSKSIGELYTAAFKGAALFVRQHDDLPIPDDTVLACQRQAFEEDAVLLSRLQQSTATGLGLSVIDVRAFVNPINLNGNNNNNNNNANDNNQDYTGQHSSSSSTDDSLEVVIIVAIVIACVAFLFLIFAIFWAWRYDKRNRQAYLAQGSAHGSSIKHRKGPNSTFDAQDSPESNKDNYPTSAHHHHHHVHSSYPSVIGGDSVFEGGVYPESVISEDIESSLSQYYNSSAAYATHTRNNMQHGNGTGNNGHGHVIGSGRLQDTASVSSMESYGYSLDGYAPSLATPMPSDAVVVTARVVSQSQQPYSSSMAYAAQAPLPMEPAATAADDEYEEDDEAAAPASSAVNVSDFTDAMMDPPQTRGYDVDDPQGPDDEDEDDDEQPQEEEESEDDDDNDNYVSSDNDISAVNTTMNSEDVVTITTGAREDPPDDDDESK